MDKAVSDINAALDALANAQRAGDFAAQGQALEDLQTAVEAYQAAQAAAGADARRVICEGGHGAPVPSLAVIGW